MEVSSRVSREISEHATILEAQREIARSSMFGPPVRRDLHGEAITGIRELLVCDREQIISVGERRTSRATGCGHSTSIDMQAVVPCMSWFLGFRLFFNAKRWAYAAAECHQSSERPGARQTFVARCESRRIARRSGG